jgi:tellurite resistance-related uncharacterized protein
MALSCLVSADLTQNLTTQPTEPPQLQSFSDLINLTSWLNATLQNARQTLLSGYVQRVPAVVYANAAGVSGTLSTASGTVGTSLAQAANAILDVYAQWNVAQGDMQQIELAMEGADDAINLINTQANIAQLNLDIQKWQNVKHMAEDVAQIASGLVSMVDPSKAAGGAVGAEAGEVGLSCDIQVGQDIDQLKDANGQLQTEQIQAAINSLNMTVNGKSTDLSNALISIRKDVNDISAGVGSIATARSAASYYAGKAAGADVWNCIGTNTNNAPAECVSHVNTVLNRRYDGYQIRYQNALQDAKALAYYARRAIEQRIGVRLSDITDQVGPLDPPSTWADDVCHLTGIDYKTLTQELADAGASGAQQQQIDSQVASAFADQFIGDYVQKLSDFVTYYNVAFPEQAGNDTSVLSMRETLLGGSDMCVGPAPNLLLSSARLYSVADGSAAQSVAGWTRHSCALTDPTCLQLRADAVAVLPPGGVPGAVSWLSDQPRLQLQNGVDVENAGTLPAPAPDNFVSQVVSLQPGTYILSWWDQARDSTGMPSMTGVPYQVEVFDSSWTPVAGFSGAPATSDTSGSQWSNRHAQTFVVTTPDVYHVAFAASVAGGDPGSVAISDVQLELANSTGNPTVYFDTTSSGQGTTFACEPSSADLRAAFTHTCDPDGTCHYDLKTPITINTQTLTANGNSLAGKLAAGNFNFRHINIALNIVGTGVVSCVQTGSPDCFGSAYVPYTLTHDGTNVGVLGWDGSYRDFDFGSASIDHGKALTAERYITIPISSADQQLISQPDIQKTEFAGRPLDGVYSLRIYDSPTFQFSQIQDIQWVINYHYWSRVVTQGSP